jgi:RNA polymerase sigma factor (sigma-70 family)
LSRGPMADLPATRASLLVRLRDSHDGGAWREFVELYAPLVYGYLRKQGLQDADAADVSQDVLGAVVASIHRLDYDPERGAFRNWLFTLVRRKLATWWTAQGRQTPGSGDTATHRFLEQSPGAEAAEQGWEAEWEHQVFAWACEQVRPTVTDATWQAFWRTAVAGQPGSQVAADLGLSVGAVYVARSRVLARLKELVQAAQAD